MTRLNGQLAAESDSVVAEIFISFSSLDTERIRAIKLSLHEAGFTTFWSHDIRTGTPNYQDVIIRELADASVVIVFWTRNSVASSPVRQECKQAERDRKLFQVVLEEIEPIYFPMDVDYAAQKALLIGWDGDPEHRDWTDLVEQVNKVIGSRTVARGLDWINPSPLLGNRTLTDVVNDVVSDWGDDIDEIASQYLEIMRHFRSATETRKIDGYPYPLSGLWVIAHFLTYSSQWRGPVARRVKKELRALQALCEVGQDLR